MFFDTHAHYDASWFDSDRDALLSALPQFGIGLIVNPGCDLPSSQMAVELAQRYDPPITKSALNHRLRKLVELAKAEAEK